MSQVADYEVGDRAKERPNLCLEGRTKAPLVRCMAPIVEEKQLFKISTLGILSVLVGGNYCNGCSTKEEICNK